MERRAKAFVAARKRILAQVHAAVTPSLFESCVAAAHIVKNTPGSDTRSVVVTIDAVKTETGTYLGTYKVRPFPQTGIKDTLSITRDDPTPPMVAEDIAVDALLTSGIPGSLRPGRGRKVFDVDIDALLACVDAADKAARAPRAPRAAKRARAAGADDCSSCSQ